MAKTPTPAQLAARERFAAMARAGAFKNPDYPGRMSVDPHGIVGVSPDVTVELEDTRNGQRRSFTSEFFVDRESIDPGWFVWGRWGGVGRGVGVVKRVAWPAGPMRKWPKITRLVQPGFRTKADAQLVADQLAAEFIRRANPLTRVKVKSPSMATGAPPSKRLTKRRKATAKAPQGYYANPSPKTRRNTQGNYNGRFDVLAWKRERNSPNGNPAFSFTIRSREYGQTLTGRTKANSQFALMLPDENPGELDAKLSVSPTGRVTMIDADMVRRGNPAKVTAVAALPTYYPVGRIAVHKAVRGKPGALLAEFPRKAQALEYARAYADAHKCGVIVVGRE